MIAFIHLSALEPDSIATSLPARFLQHFYYCRHSWYSCQTDACTHSLLKFYYSRDAVCRQGSCRQLSVARYVAGSKHIRQVTGSHGSAGKSASWGGSWTPGTVTSDRLFLFTQHSLRTKPEPDWQGK